MRALSLLAAAERVVRVRRAEAGQTMRDMREASGWSLREVAEATGWSRSLLNMIESGERWNTDAFRAAVQVLAGLSGGSV